jgi:hypothetical protein
VASAAPGGGGADATLKACGRLGCGGGRRALLSAEHGFAVEAINTAAAGIDFAGEASARGRVRLLAFGEIRVPVGSGACFAMDAYRGTVRRRDCRAARFHLDIGAKFEAGSSRSYTSTLKQ